jgi:hypothetical protein
VGGNDGDGALNCPKNNSSRRVTRSYSLEGAKNQGMVAYNQISAKALSFPDSTRFNIETNQDASHRRIGITNLQADIVPVFSQMRGRNTVNQTDYIRYARCIFLSHFNPTNRMPGKKKECTGSPVHSWLKFWFLVQAYSAGLISSSDPTVAEPGG